MFQIREIWTFIAPNSRSLLVNWPVSIDLMISPAEIFTSIGIVAFLIWIIFDLLGMKFTFVPESAVAFVISNFLRLIWVDAFDVICNFYLVSFVLANEYPPGPSVQTFSPIYKINCIGTGRAWDMAFETSETLGDFVVCSPSTLRIVPIFEGCLRLTIPPSGIPIVPPSVFSTSLDSLSVISDSVLIFYLNIPSSL